MSAISKKFALLILLLTWQCSGLESSPPWKAAPGHENTPVIFWAHYMPQVDWGFLHAGGHVGGNADVWPFSPQTGSKTELYRQAMEAALESGINGFQFLTWIPPEAFDAAEQIRRDSGRIFYLAPEWCDMGADTRAAAEKIAAFVKTYEKSPFLYRRDGKQVHFLYNHGKWSGSSGDQSSDKLPEARKIMKELGVEVVLVPTIGDIWKVLLDRPDLNYRPFPAFRKAEPGEFRYLKETGWDGATGLNGGANLRQNLVDEVKTRLAAAGRPFFAVPSMRSMYDSSNRYWQAIHCRGLGVRVLHRDLRLWLRAGFRQLTFSTWNDVNETMLMPSSRNIWGLNDMILYYRSLAETGRSPFEQTNFVLSYEPEVLLGDQGYFQLLAMPAKDPRSGDYSAEVSLRDVNGNEVLSFGLFAQLDAETEDVLAESRYETSNLPVVPGMVLTPYLTLREIDKSSGESRLLFDRLRLAPIRIRHNKLHYHVPYTISLRHVAPDAGILLRWNGEAAAVKKVRPGTLESVRVEVDGETGFRRIDLAESSLSLGAFRADETPDAPAQYAVRLSASPATRAALKIGGGQVLNTYVPHWNLAQNYFEVNKPSAYVAIPDSYRSLPVTVRIQGAPESRVNLRLAGASGNAIDCTVAELAAAPVRKELVADGRKTVLDARLTTDVTDVNRDYPVPAKATLNHSLPAARGHEAVRAFHTWGLDDRNRVCFSNVLVAENPERPDRPRPVRFLRTGGVFDDFVNDSSSAAVNRFSASDVVTRNLPANLIEYNLLDFDENCGREVNANGTSHQLGRGWLEGSTEWLAEGFRGGALKLNGDGVLKLRSKTMPHGCLTLSMRVMFSEETPKDRTLFEDGDYYQMRLSGPLSIRLDGDGKVVAWRPASGADATVNSAAGLKPGWNHIAVTYDLQKLTLYVNGRKEAEREIAPTYQRTHSTPALGARKINNPPGQLRFNGAIDQLEIVGESLGEEEIARLCEQGNVIW